MTPRSQAFLRQLKVKYTAISDNCRFEERLDAQRWQVFEEGLPDIGLESSWSDWTEASNLHYEKRVTVPSTSVPDAFLDINRRAWKPGLEGNQTVVRIETLHRPLHDRKCDLKEFRQLWQDRKKPDTAQALADFFDTWNQSRDNRPSFVAFYDEVRDEVEAADWPHALRDRLGLAHLKGHSEAPTPVALMRYPLEYVLDIQTQRGLKTACALPTVLDGGMHEYFFPSPAEHDYGATLHLDPEQADLLTAEMLHCSIPYRPEHLYKLGEITCARELQDNALREARDLHLLALRLESGCEDFGEEMLGRHE